MPAVTEGGAAEAADKAAAEPPSELRAGRAEALSTDGRAGGPHRPSIDRRVWSASLTSRAARSVKECVAPASTVASSRLKLHLALVSRIDLLLRKGRRERM